MHRRPPQKKQRVAKQLDVMLPAASKIADENTSALSLWFDMNPGKRVLVQPKLDGCRMRLVKLQGASHPSKNEDLVVMAMSRTNLARPHWHEIGSLAKFLPSFPVDTIIDGEFYKHGETFEDIMSLFKRNTVGNDPFADPDWSGVAMHMFDITPAGPGTPIMPYNQPSLHFCRLHCAPAQ